MCTFVVNVCVTVSSMGVLSYVALTKRLFFDQFVTRIATVISNYASHLVGVMGGARAEAEAWYTHIHINM